MNVLKTYLQNVQARLENATIIPSLQGYYSATPNGDIISIKHKWRGNPFKIMKGHADEHGYLRVILTLQNKRIKKGIHQLVCEAFHGKKPSDMHEVCHKDGNRQNNCASNLRWGTRKENAADREKHGNTARGSKNGFFKYHCKNGHDLAVHGRHQKGGGRACRLCAKAYKKDWYLQRKARQAIEQVNKLVSGNCGSALAALEQEKV